MSSNIVKSAVLILLLFTYLNGYAQAQSSAPAMIAADQELKSVTAGTVDTIPLKLDPSITGGDLIHVMFADTSLTISLVNAANPLPDLILRDGTTGPPRNQISYEAVASDAKNPQGGALDSTGYHGSIVAKRMYGNYQTTKMIHFAYTGGKITGGTVEAPSGPVRNDLVVPLSSQQYSTPPAGSPSFASLPAGQVLFRNHSTVGKADIGTIVSQRLTVDRQNGLKK